MQLDTMTDSTHDSEAWFLTQKNEQRFGISKRKVLKIIYGPVQVPV